MLPSQIWQSGGVWRQSPDTPDGWSFADVNESRYLAAPHSPSWPWRGHEEQYIFADYVTKVTQGFKPRQLMARSGK